MAGRRLDCISGRTNTMAGRRLDCISRHLTMSADEGGVLSGVRVVELATVVAAPSCAALMRDHGAEVIKVETPSGDSWRREAQMLTPDQPFGVLFENTNRGKKSVTIDLKNSAGVATFRRLVATADVMITNVRAPALARLGLDYDTIHSDFPSLIYAHLTAWGRSGPQRDRPGYDAGAFWAATGIQDITRANDDAPPSRYPGAIGDHTTGLALLSGIGLALFHRERTGEGQLVDASLLRTGAWVMSVPYNLASVGAGRSPRRDRENANNPTFNTYRTADKKWVQLLGLETMRHLPGTLEALGIGELNSDERYSTFKMAMRNRRELIKLMSKAFSTRTLEEWRQIFDHKGVWYSSMASFEEVLDDVQLNATGGFERIEGVKAAILASPVKLSAFSTHGAKGRAPVLGAHNEELLSEK